MTDGRTDRRTDRRTDGGDCNIPDAFLKKRGDNKLQWRILYGNDHMRNDQMKGNRTIVFFIFPIYICKAFFQPKSK